VLLNKEADITLKHLPLVLLLHVLSASLFLPIIVGNIE